MHKSLLNKFEQEKRERWTGVYTPTLFSYNEYCVGESKSFVTRTNVHNLTQKKTDKEGFGQHVFLNK